MRHVLVTLALALVVTGSARATLLTNGGFEDPAGEGASSVTGWSFSGDGGLRTETPDQYQGAQFVRLAFAGTFDGGQTVDLAQTFTVGSSGVFDLSFAYQLRETFCGCDDLFANTIFDVVLDGASLTDGDLADASDFAPGDVASNWSAGRWDVERYAVSLSAGSHTLDFRFSRASSLFGRNYQLGLDGVTLVSTGGETSVPEPSTVVLVGVAVAGLAGVSRRRRMRAMRAG